MGLNLTESIALVTSSTRMQGLLKRWGSKSTAKFRMKRAKLGMLSAQASGGNLDDLEQMAAQDFDEVAEEENRYESAVTKVRSEIDVGLPIAVVPREYLSTYNFALSVAVVVVGQDGLVANTAKYVRDTPIIGVNPDPSRIDGVLLPYTANQVRPVVQRVLKRNARLRSVTLGEVRLNDGQHLLAFNDFFIGCQTHTSARYRLTSQLGSEVHSSSGVIVSTGAGCTGWLSSVFNMARGVAGQPGHVNAVDESQPTTIAPVTRRTSTTQLAITPTLAAQPQLTWEDRRLIWVVREPFASKHSQANLVIGQIAQGEQLQIESMMSQRGVIFSDGIESDAIEFNAGSIAQIGVADQKANLVVD